MLDNTVGSHEPLVAFIARKRQTLWVQPRQLEILKGSILGDAFVAPLGKIQIEHSTKQLEYLMWKYQALASITYGSMPVRVPRYNRLVKKHYESIRFWTRQFFRPLRSQFYDNKRKIFPSDLKLTPLMMAVWYMDDGHYEVKKKRCILATDQFDQESMARIQSALWKEFSIETILWKSGKLAFPQRSAQQLFLVIRSYIVPTMSYKISLTP